QSQNEIRRVRHDLSTSLSHLFGLIKAGQIAECNDLISTLTHTVTENNQIDELDLSFICANILDNAIEATEHCAIIDPAITFKISFDAKLKTLYITCQNPTINESLTKTTKTDQRNHGFGLSTIRQIAKGYGGTVNCQIEDGWFLIVVGMPE
ncbi:MAG: GHKL domain-containing protein, partial [Phocaeicola sp.]